jgi:hypothetical protein
MVFPEGFRWRITSSDYPNDLSTTGAITEPDGQWTDELTGQVPSADSAIHFLLTTQSFTPDLQSALRANKYTPTIKTRCSARYLRLFLAGATFQAKLPIVEFSGSQTSQLTGTIMGAFMSYVLVPEEHGVTRLLLKVVTRTTRWAAPGLCVGDLIMARRQLLNFKQLAERHQDQVTDSG